MRGHPTVPREGMLATIRNRRGLVASVEPFDGAEEGRLHLVRVEYTDSDGTTTETVLWEREHGRELLEPHALPLVESEPPMRTDEFDALVRAARWSALTPFLSPTNPEHRSELPIAAPFFGAVQVDDFQLVPLLKALQMPRVSLLLADDVGLGKTIEAGLILTELLLRRRVRRVLILTPASLRLQWQQEMKEKFSLGFDLIDRQETHQLRKRLGLDANPWRTFPRIITSYHYLRQPDVLEQFMATCRSSEGTAGQHAQLPWDMLIVDEAHNLMPASFGEDSDLAKMLRTISPHFEHKLFLTATPHNGHTRCFSGLLEQLDPVRFTQTSEFTDDERRRVEEVVVRRLKREINELDDAAGRPRRFGDRHLEPVPLYLGRAERALSLAMADFRKAVKTIIRHKKKTEQVAGSFAIEVLNKRLLSCPYTFAESWFRLKAGAATEETVEAEEVCAARRASEEDLDDDQEREGRVQHAAKVVGAWLRPYTETLSDKVAAIDSALAALGLRQDGETTTTPVADQRVERLVDLIRKHLRTSRGWRSDERLIVFTEYKTTLDYLERRLRKEFSDDGCALRVLYGGMGPHERDDIKSAFNDPADPVRVLVATDAASEGLNLQETARLLLHYEIPWNPSRLEQRNGRLDRHGQARDVFVHHFTSEEDADLDFIAHVVKKVHDIREDLGSVGDLFDAAFQRRFIDQEDATKVKASLDRDVEGERGAATIPRETPHDTGLEEARRVEELRRHVDLAPETLRQTLEVALGIGFGQPRLRGPDARGRMELARPIPPLWEALVDDTLRLPGPASIGAMPGIVFDPAHFIHDNDGRPVFRSSKDTVLLHLGHPMFKQALAMFARARFPGGHEAFSASRWTVSRGSVPTGARAVLLLTVEELAINELREPFHHWVRTLEVPVLDGQLGMPVECLPGGVRPEASFVSADAGGEAADVWDDVKPELRPLLQSMVGSRTRTVEQLLVETGKRSIAEEKEKFAHRLKEVERAMRETTLNKLEKELEKTRRQLWQRDLFRTEQEEREMADKIRGLEEELRRRRSHYEDLLQQLRLEQDRILVRMLPKRFRLSGKVRVFPVSVELRLPEVGR